MLKDKIVNLQDIVVSLRKSQKTAVMTVGVFNIPFNESFLKTARNLGSCLIVGVLSDSLAKISMPGVFIYSTRERMEFLSRFQSVDSILKLWTGDHVYETAKAIATMTSLVFVIPDTMIGDSNFGPEQMTDIFKILPENTVEIKVLSTKGELV